MSDGAKITASLMKKLSGFLSNPFPALMPPKGLSNFETSQWMDRQLAADQLFIAGLGKSFFEKAHKSAKEACEKLGVWSDVDKLAPGAAHTLFDGAHVVIQCKINNPGTKVDMDALATELMKLGVKGEVLAKAVKAATICTTPAKRIEASAK